MSLFRARLRVFGDFWLCLSRLPVIVVLLHQMLRRGQGRVAPIAPKRAPTNISCKQPRLQPLLPIIRVVTLGGTDSSGAPCSRACPSIRASVRLVTDSLAVADGCETSRPTVLRFGHGRVAPIAPDIASTKYPADIPAYHPRFQTCLLRWVGGTALKLPAVTILRAQTSNFSKLPPHIGLCLLSPEPSSVHHVQLQRPPPPPPHPPPQSKQPTYHAALATRIPPPPLHPSTFAIFALWTPSQPLRRW